MYWFIQFPLFFILIFLLYIFWRSKEKKTPNLPPGPKGLPFLGFIPFLDKNHPYKQFAKLSKKYGSIMSIPIGSTNVIVLNDWTAIKECLVAKSTIFSGRPKLHKYEQMMHFDDIFASDGPRWKEQRRFALHEMRKLGIGKIQFEDIILNEVRPLTEHITEISNKVIPISKLCFIPVINIIWSSMSGNRFDIKDDPKMTKFTEYLWTIFEETSLLGLFNFFPILRYVPGPWNSHASRFQESNNKIIDYIKDEIDNHVKTYKNGIPRDFIDVYLAEIYKRDGSQEKDSPYQMKHLVGTVYDMFLAGVETTQTTLEFGILYMVHWPEVQNKIHEELDTVIGGHRYINYADHIHLPYTEATLLEIQRFASIVPLSPPRTPVVTTEVMGYTIPKGTFVIHNLWAVHHDKDYWDDPDAFRPERFLSENGKVKKPEYLIPFSVGARMCMGEALAKMELFLFFSNLLHRFSFHCAPEENLPSIDPILGSTFEAQPFSLMVKQRQLHN